METPKIPANEQDRLFQLRSAAILDTPPEERFDRVTRMARRIFGVPVALVSLVDENRQWFKSCFGLDVSETPREISFCGHAILEEQTFVIEDTLKDERFFDNPLVTGEPYIRFYAGQPLRPLSGQAMGTLCVIDRAPREFSAEDRQMLVDFAQMVEREIVAVQLSVLDELTRISNRRGLLVLARYSLDVCKRQQFQAVLVFFDLDKFKEINDTLGHAEGDRALKTFSAQLSESFRASDIYARLGGDEFVVLLSNTSDVVVQELIERFRANLQTRCAKFGLPYSIQFSYGVVAFDPFKHATVEDMLQEADAAMYSDKVSRKQNKSC